MLERLGKLEKQVKETFEALEGGNDSEDGNPGEE
jgi:hypothetical protein